MIRRATTSTVRATLLLAGVLTLAACGESDDTNASSDEAAPEATSAAETDEATPAADTESEAAEEQDEAEAAAGDPSTDGDLTAQLLAAVFGLPADFVSVDQRACMNDQLAPWFPDGQVPENYSITEEVSDALDEAAETCGVSLS